MGQRIETGVEQGGDVTPFYDPMIAKLVKHDDSREHAIEGMLRMIEESFVAPLSTNMGFLHACLDCQPFRAADLDTGLIERLGDALIEHSVRDDLVVEAAKRIVWRKQQDHPTATMDLLMGLEGFRLNDAPRRKVTAFVGTEARAVTLSDELFTTFGVHELDDDTMLVNDCGTLATVTFRPPAAMGGASTADGAILAPMPGKVIALDVAEGQVVKEGDRLMVLEAMKMEHALTAPFDGTVSALEASEGGQVQVEAVLCVVEPAE